MKTAIGELIEYFEQQIRLQRESKIKYSGEEAYFDALDVCRNAHKTKEREQILNAFVAGDERGTGEIPFNCEQYYDQTYGNKAETAT